MYCRKCGSQMKDDANFCEKCGTSVNPEKSLVNISIGSISLEALKSKDKLLMITSVALLVLSFIFSVTNVFSIEAPLIGEQGRSLYGSAIVGILFFLLYLLSVAVVTVPDIFKKADKVWAVINERDYIRFLPAMIVAALSLLWLIVVLILGKNEVNSSSFGSLVEFSLSATGWLYVIVTISTFAVSLVNFMLHKNNKN